MNGQVSVSVFQALVLAIWIALIESRSLLGAATVALRFSPLMTGLIVGILFGDVTKAMEITAAIQLIYMGVFAPGGQMPAEPCIAAAISVPIALLSGMKPTAAIAIAVPVGLLGGYLYQFRLFLDSFVNKITEKGVEEVNKQKIFMGAIVVPIIVSLVLFIPFMFIALKFGAPVIASFVKNSVSTEIFHILSVIGGGLVSIGIATTIYVIGKKSYIPFFLSGYFIAVVCANAGLTMLTYAIFGALIASVFILVRSEASFKNGEE
ncbi:PTS mannose/fructose/sorbose/N-acetylgalactosamine transporter subunit IIC [Lactobacillus kullabergensis]|uniref:PTS sugar transporter subunit IIC n=1 Tax=Lactobacillus kullabergensis TaxID=1218493 RepID=A0ABM6W2J1_9LACO|nr:PTS sugar transporter subunit IIC [Lactobacillus kullabergensis]AWM76091.1 PTS sugar transporter subunit IIC [Lactobacillus kullabergensis]